jgi:hypothetical protein
VSMTSKYSSNVISEEALRLFKTSPFFGAWHPDTLQLYVTYGLCKDSQGGVRLKMSSMHEALVFSDHIGSNEAWELLEKVDERIELRWIVPGKPKDKGCVTLCHKLCATNVRFRIGGEKATRVRVWRRPANSSNVVFHFAGHLVSWCFVSITNLIEVAVAQIPHEAPEELGK